jgi:glycyl-tRNA synthetase
MFRTFVGPVEDAASVAYLRPETCQPMFVNFKQIQTVSRLKVPFGIAQVGKAFRNEVNPRNFIFRSREFEQMEMEFFVKPAESKKWFDFWVQERFAWYKGLGVRPEKLRLRPQAEDERAHYASAAFDVEYEFPFGWQELEGIAHRGSYDLTQHQTHSWPTSTTRRASTSCPR